VKVTLEMVLTVEFAGGAGTDVVFVAVIGGAVVPGAAVIAESEESEVTERMAAQAARSNSSGQHQG
jgi:hypothetical protein